MKRIKNAEPFPDVPGCTTTFTKDSSSSDCYQRLLIVTVNSKSKKVDELAPVFAHEATHVAQKIWEYVGEIDPGFEQEAYLIQYLVQEFIRIYKDERVQPRRVSNVQGSGRQRVQSKRTSGPVLLHQVHGGYQVLPRGSRKESDA